MRIASFNLQNLRLRHGAGGPRLDGARDRDTGESAAPRLDHRDRELTARVIAALDADVIALQEVFDRATLELFHDTYLLPTGIAAYTHRICLPGNDGRGLDLALLSRVRPADIRSHAKLRPGDLGLTAPAGHAAETPVFRRDCLVVDIGALMLVIVHFKAPYPDAAAAWPVRHLEALAVRRLIERRFDDPARGLWMILGDLNDPARQTEQRAVSPVLPPFSVSLLDRLPGQERWTYYDAWSGGYGRPDDMLASPALAAAFPDSRPDVHREGLGLEARRHTGIHLPQTGRHRPHASDHAALVIEFPGLGAPTHDRA